MFRALEARSLAGILLDSFVAGAYRGQISSNVRVNKIISYDSSYGIVFRDAMASRELQTCFNNYVSDKKNEISTIVEDNTSPVKVGASFCVHMRNEQSSRIFLPAANQAPHKTEGLPRRPTSWMRSHLAPVKRNTIFHIKALFHLTGMESFCQF